ncbi:MULTISPECIES: CHASE2 domain-containing protein [Moorena]|uniref:Putative transmembrane sensor domain protein n=2 Tax=Moorena TaxID=1155738 RepID=F4XSP1_9CYAN|nr:MULTISPECIES: CHASE2 domain-containing protein [Moorena]EGJ32366.1 putative transmembrane sensor domain protein [Moorena producens 3L]NEP30970.1 CHASE2 domain-containing protein [Moorena sp. SIO3B2]NEP68603.1 CHASE2 domain-containing protein [Moorena sp. SIO3A5]NER91310.1 CHASE2 domain-containing protein [Moorena sp. SIO3A2]NET68268.1 CHASE2 domain-containing protein [Moorena sp. SIO1G6]
MTNLVTLKIVDGDFEQGFRVILKIGIDAKENNLMAREIDGWLPPAPHINQLCDSWLLSYRAQGRIKVHRKLTAPSEQITNYSIIHSAQDLQEAINNWLNSTDRKFQRFRDQVLKSLSTNDQIRFIIQTNNLKLWQLPWHLWDVLSDCDIEVNFSASEFPPPSPPSKKYINKVRILAILGDDTGIDIQKDLALLQEELPDAEISPLISPQKKQLSQELWEKKWEILFFAGHSFTQNKKNLQGRFFINQDESITIEELKYGLTNAIKNGLKLAIFNSCDGLGLAAELVSLPISTTLVMREKVPDEVAQKFLRYFLNAFATKGKSLSDSVWETRKRLQEEVEDNYPCASWLPVIFQNPALKPPTWKDLTKGFYTKNKPKLSTVLLVSFIATIAVITIRSLGLLQGSELRAFDHLMGLRPPEKRDERVLVIAVEEPDIKYQDKMGWSRKGSLSDTALAQLLRKLNPDQPRVIGLDIYHDFEFEPSLATQLKQNPRFIAVCKMPSIDQTAIASPPGMASQQIGFSDLPRDPDDIIRRQFLAMTPSDTCDTSYSLSLQVALNYLAQEGIPPMTRNSAGDVEIGGVMFRKFPHNAGGYQLEPDHAMGYQMLLNYRAKNPKKVNLQDLLKGKLDSQLPTLVKDKIVLIGVGKDSKDVHLTPYTKGPWPDKIPGVMVHAQMTSQIISAVLNQRPLLWWLPQWGELLWIGSWSLVGGLLVWRLHSPSYLGVAVFAGISLLSGVCYVLLLQGGWIPFIPSALGLVATSGSIVVYSIFK